MQFPFNRFLMAVSDCLDFIEIDVLGATTNHARRVAYISLRLAERFGLSEEELHDLCSFAMLHDNGLCQEVFSGEVALPETKDIRTRLESYRMHCRYGEDNISHYPFLTDNRNVVLYHHENWDGSGYFGVKGDEIPLMAQIIALADTVDNLFHFENPSIANRRSITEFIKAHNESWFSPLIVEAFLDTQKHVSFWLDLQEPQLHEALESRIPDIAHQLSLDDIFAITRVFAYIVDSKSPFTHRHTMCLEEKVGVMGKFYKMDGAHITALKIAASLHDLGKLAIPNSILDKPGKLEADEMELMKSHVYYTDRALAKIKGFEEIAGWAARHHEKLNGGGYPYGISAEGLSFEERLMACLDIYQALTEERPYRPSMSHKEAASILYMLADKGELDADITKNIDTVFSDLLK